MIESQTNNSGSGQSDQPIHHVGDAPIGHMALQSDGARGPTAVVRHARSGFLRRFFWLDDKIAELTSAGSWANHATWPELQVIRGARDGLDALGDKDTNGTAAAILRRTKVLLLIRVLMLRQGLDCASGHLTERDWTAGEQVTEIRDMLSRLTINELASLKVCLGKDAEMSLVGLNAEELKLTARSLRRAAELLMEPVNRDDEQIHRFKRQRWLRVGVALAAVSCVLVAAGVKFQSFKHKPNLALNRPTWASSYSPGEILPNHKAPDASRAVDGIRSAIGFHTESDVNPFLVIDLGKSQNFDKVVVFNRMDCCQERAVPIFLEVSDDDKQYRTIAERHETFTSWTADGLHAKGRYVRLRVKATTYFHLSEVEIY